MSRRRRRYRPEHWDSIGRAGPLRLDSSRKKIGGVCAGIANYFGCSTFIVRLLSVIALVMMPHITLPAYGLAYLILDEDLVHNEF
jgi:phage shock protein PspC (stress-responsive transcriptional regulator)